jgi:hypothetical protein
MPEFKDLNLPIPETVSSLPEEEQLLIYNYLIQLDNLNLKAYNIAYKNLGSSFNISRSNGFIKWKKQNTSST